MALDQQTSGLATRMAQEIKAVRTEMAAPATGGGLFIFTMEENGSLNSTANNGFQFSIGNGAANAEGAELPFACVARGLSIRTRDYASGVVEIYKNGLATGATISLVNSKSAFRADLNILVNAGDALTFRTISGSDGGYVVVTVALATDGIQGDSTYKVWLDAGNAGTQAAFLASLKGRPGEDGEDGDDSVVPGPRGNSAYQVWLDAGNAGTQAAFLASLKGRPGEDGEDGDDSVVPGPRGNSAYRVWLDAGNAGSQADFIASLKGRPGEDGEDGDDSVVPGPRGHSTYKVWLDAGNAGTQAAFLASLKGRPGEDGEDGDDSVVPGPRGNSAYRVWLDAGNAGSQADFIASLKGLPGTGGVGVSNSWMKRSSGSTQAITESFVNIPFATLVNDETQGDITYAAGAFTAKVAGNYKLGGFITVTDASGQRAQVEIQIFIDGIASGRIHTGGYIRNMGSSDDDWTISLSNEPFALTAGQTIEVRIKRATDVTTTIVDGVNSLIWFERMTGSGGRTSFADLFKKPPELIFSGENRSNYNNPYTLPEGGFYLAERRFRSTSNPRFSLIHALDIPMITGVFYPSITVDITAIGSAGRPNFTGLKISANNSATSTSYAFFKIWKLT